MSESSRLFWAIAITRKLKRTALDERRFLTANGYARALSALELQATALLKGKSMSTITDNEQRLCDEWLRFCTEQGLPCDSADELLSERSETLTDDQKHFIMDFIDRWEREIG